MAMIDDQFERCKAAVVRLENAMPENCTGETKLEIAAHEVHDLDVFLQNARHAINVMRNMTDLRNDVELKLSKAVAVLQRYPEALAEWQRDVERGRSWLVEEVARNCAIDKSAARRAVVTGGVWVNNVKVDDPAALVVSGDLIEVFSDGEPPLTTSRLLAMWCVS